MGLKSNIAANYLSQGFVAAAGILAVPLYARYMGAEAYGLIGFYSLLQAWFQMLDAGLSTTMSREAARFNGGSADVAPLLRLRQIVEWIFLAIAAVGMLTFFFGARFIVEDWLHVHDLPVSQVVLCVQLIGLIIAARWMSCLYRGLVTGFERQVWLSGLNAIVAALRFLAFVPIMMVYPAKPLDYFAFQVGVSLFEVVALACKSNALLPRRKLPGHEHVSWSTLQPMIRFASGVGLTSTIWILVTQSDKLALSRILPLSAYGEYSMAVLLASGINLLSAPIGIALLPRLTALYSAGRSAEGHSLYRRYTELVCVVTIPPALTMAFFSHQVLYLWTGNADIAMSVSPVLALYALGNALLGIAAFVYFLQYAMGDIRLHVIGNVLFAALYLPIVVACAIKFGAIGAGAAWLAMNLVYLLIWTRLVHGRLTPGHHWQWLAGSVGVISLFALAPAAIVPWISKISMGRYEGGIAAMLFGLCSTICAITASPFARQWLRQRWVNRRVA